MPRSQEEFCALMEEVRAELESCLVKEQTPAKDTEEKIACLRVSLLKVSFPRESLERAVALIDNLSKACGILSAGNGVGRIAR